MLARVCARGEVGGQRAGGGYAGRNSVFPVTVLRIAVPPSMQTGLFASDPALTSQHLIMKNFKHTVMLNNFRVNICASTT